MLPGLIDAHVHVDDGSHGGLSQAISLGVTTVLEMWNSGGRLKAIKKIQRDDALDVADIRSAGTGATAPGGHPTRMGGPPFPTLTGPAEAQAFVDARLAEGSDYVKIVYDDLAAILPKAVPMLHRTTLEALVQAAHRRQRLAVVPVTSEQHAHDAIRAGADGLVHLFFGSSASSDFGQLAARRRIFVIPTLSTLYEACEPQKAQPSSLTNGSVVSFDLNGRRP